MPRNQEVIAIYSRKSRLYRQGESIGNQVELCRTYIRTAFGDACADGAVVFEDEGFSGGNLNRPDFKRMMKAARDHQFKGGGGLPSGPDQPQHQRLLRPH